MNCIKTWSFSRLADYELCPLKAKFKYLDKIPEPERPLPPGKTEHANDRGSRIHDAAEKFIKGDIELIPELVKFRRELEHVKAMYAKGKVTTEGEWAMTKNWQATGWSDPDAWLRLKCDITVRVAPDHLVVIDLKTGKKFGNEIKHMDQVQLYQLVCFLRYPELKRVDVELWYTDIDELTHADFGREKGVAMLGRYNKRAIMLTTDETFKATPNQFSCKWCPYGPKGTGHCTVGIQ